MTKNIEKPVREPGPLDGQRQTLSPRCCFPHATQPAEALVRRDSPTEKDTSASDRVVHTGVLARSRPTRSHLSSPRRRRRRWTIPTDRLEGGGLGRLLGVGDGCAAIALGRRARSTD